MTDVRPDPDQLLAQVTEREASARRGRFRDLFGASAGVGKTYSMLTAAALRHEGRDVVVGLLETHGRKETEALLHGLEIASPREDRLPGSRARRIRSRRGARAPSRADSRRRARAYERCAARAIPSGGRTSTSCWPPASTSSRRSTSSTSSLNDVVGGITGINVRETIPDAFFDRADEVVLVDVSADDLLQRLKAGKVYLPEQIERAASHFFRKAT